MPKGYPAAMERLIEELARLPGIGQRTAERLAYHILKAPTDEALRLADAVRAVKETVGRCSVCHNLSDADPCDICSDAGRDPSVVCVVEQPRDVMALEKAGAFKGVYHVLMGRLAPLEGVEPEHLSIADLVQRARRGDVQEVILATNPDYEGDSTALYIQKELEGLPVRVTRIARGLPSGGSIEHASTAILTDALLGRRAMEEETRS